MVDLFSMYVCFRLQLLMSILKANLILNCLNNAIQKKILKKTFITKNLGQNSKSEIVTKHKSNCDNANCEKTQIVTKLKKANCDKTQLVTKFNWFQNVSNVVHPNVAVRTFSSMQNSSLAFVMSSSDKVPDMYRNQASGALFLSTDGASSRVIHDIYIYIYFFFKGRCQFQCPSEW